MDVEYHDAIHGVNGVTTCYLFHMDTLKDYVRERREIRGLSVTDLAIEAGMTKSEVSAIENGRIKWPGADKRRRLAAALGVTHLELVIAAGELARDEVPGATQAGPPPDPRIEELMLLLKKIDLDFGGRADHLSDILTMWDGQDRDRRRKMSNGSHEEIAG